MQSVRGVFGVRRVCLPVEQAIVVFVTTNLRHIKPRRLELPLEHAAVVWMRAHLDLYNLALFVWTVFNRAGPMSDCACTIAMCRPPFRLVDSHRDHGTLFTYGTLESSRPGLANTIFRVLSFRREL